LTAEKNKERRKRVEEEKAPRLWARALITHANLMRLKWQNNTNSQLKAPHIAAPFQIPQTFVHKP
jgi:hypothetical protein